MTSKPTRRLFLQGAVLALFSVLAVLFAANAYAITIPTVPVGNPGNAVDPTGVGLYGAVSYNYRIGTTEVTVGQYTAFLNAVAATDAYGLYNTGMATDPIVAGIARSGASGSYSYSVIGSANHPVTYVNWGDAARFANWLHNGQPTGAEGPGTTETGAYTLTGATLDAALNAVTRNAGATWFIPTENEWYKAAYYQPAAQGGDTDNYWDYPMRTNDTPYSDQPPGTTPDNTRVGNFYDDDGLDNGYNDGNAATGSTSYSNGQNYVTDVGAYSSSSSFYGTFDQGGNVWEWTEAITSPSSRGIRGGSFGSTWYSLASFFSIGSPPAYDEGGIGFRVASVPEPSTAVLGASGMIGLLLWRRRRK